MTDRSSSSVQKDRREALPRYLWRLLWVTMALALAVAVWLGWSWDPETVRQHGATVLGRFLPSDSTGPVEVEFHDQPSGETLRLRIPRDLVATKNWAGGRQEVVHLRTNLSELMARSREAQGLPPPDTDSQDPPGWGPGRNTVYIHLWSGKRLPDGPKRAYDSLRSRTTYLGEVHGLEHYRHKCERYVEDGGEKRKIVEDCAGLRRDLFVTVPSTPDQSLDFSCVSPEDNPRGGCVVNTSHRGWTIEYIFGRTELHRWKEFDGAIRELIDSFVVTAPRGGQSAVQSVEQ